MTAPAPVTDLEPGIEIDPGIADVVWLLRAHGLETVSSCQGGEGHASPTPTVYFEGDDNAGLWAVWVLADLGYGIAQLARLWDFEGGITRSPFWKITLWSGEPVARPKDTHSWVARGACYWGRQ